MSPLQPDAGRDCDEGWRDRLLEYIRASGGRVSTPRMLVAEVFFEMEGHPGVDELAAEVRRRHPGIGYATVYRTMKLLAEAGLVATREFGDGFARYEPECETSHHDHLICTGCGRIVEFEDDGIEALQERVTRQHGFVMQRHRLEIYGLCDQCVAAGRGS
jgi:Fur family ferric uptake transcriptional regulator